MKKILVISLLLIGSVLSAQVNLDSLWTIWKSPTSSTEEKLEAMTTLSFDGYIYSNPDSAFLLAQLQYDLAKKTGNKKYEAKALNTQGTTYYFKSNYAKAIDSYTKALLIQDEIGEQQGQGSTMNNMGAIYYDQGDLDKALEWYMKSLAIREKLQVKKGMAASYNNIGAVYADKSEFAQAIEYYTRSLKIREELNDKVGIATSYNNIGKVYSYMKNEKKAREYYEKGLAIREEIGDKRGLVMSMYNIALNYSKTGDRRSAINYGEKALRLAREIKSLMQQSYIAAGLYEDYRSTGNYKKALEMHILYNDLKDTIKSEDNQKEILRQEMQYQYDKQKALDEKEHEKKIELAAEQEAKQRTLNYLIGGGLLLVLLFAFFIYNRLQLTRKQKQTIEEQKHIVEEKQKEILDSITYAKRLQEAILPPTQLISELFPDSFVVYQPKEIVAGDFYWMESFAEAPDSKGRSTDLILLAAADCTGHGVPGAMVSVVCSNSLNRSVKELGITDPGKVLDKTQELVLENFAKSDTEVKDGMDISLACINRKNNELQWAGARIPLWILRNGQFIKIDPDAHSIGKNDSSQVFKTHKLGLLKGDLLLLFTDGYAEQKRATDGKKFSSEALQQLIIENADAPPERISEKLKSTFQNWKGSLEQADDICIVGIRIR